MQNFKQAHAKKNTPAAQEPTNAQHYSGAAEPVMAIMQGQSATKPRDMPAQQKITLEKNQFRKQQGGRIQAVTQDPAIPLFQKSRATSQTTPS